MNKMTAALSAIANLELVIGDVDDTSEIRKALKIYKATHIVWHTCSHDYLWQLMDYMSTLLDAPDCSLQTVTVLFDHSKSIFGAFTQFIQMFENSSSITMESFDLEAREATFTSITSDKAIGVRVLPACMEVWDTYTFEVYYLNSKGND